MTVPLKVMFVVDTSASNNSATMNSGLAFCDPAAAVCAPPTDPTKSFRVGSITEFFNRYSAQANISWGFMTFSDGRADAIINAASTQKPIFADASIMQAAINVFSGTQDKGDTPYLAALNLVKASLLSDPDLNSTSTGAAVYSVVFLSDGYPTDASNPDGSVNQNALNASVADIQALAPGRVSISTVYYGTINDPKAAGALQSMAIAGNGGFVNVNTASTKTIDFQPLIPAVCR